MTTETKTPEGRATMTNRQRFESMLADKFRALFRRDDYAMAARLHTPEGMAAKMADKLTTNPSGASKDGEGVKAVCKALGIRHTYTAIREYLNG